MPPSTTAIPHPQPLAGPRFLLSIDEMPKKLHRSEDVWVEDGDFYIAVRSVLSFLPHIITVSL